MEKINYSKWFWVGVLIVVGYTLFAQIMLNIPSADDLNVLTISNYLLSGKKYYYDFFETNPPLIFWITTPAVFLYHWFPISIWTAILIFNCIVWGVTFWLCLRLVQKKFFNDPKAQQWILFFIAIATFLLPNSAFGEREPLTFMMVLPYLLLVSLRLQKKTLPSSAFIFCVALLAAIGFSLKPYFLLCFILIEIFYAIRAKAIHWKRMEAVVIAVFLMCYLISIAIFTPEYYEKILPLTNTLYLHYSAVPISMLIRLPLSFFIVLGLLFLLGFSVFFLWADDVFVIFILSAVAFYGAALIPRQYWYYHFVPADQCVFLALTYFLYVLATDKKKFSHWRTVCFFILVLLGASELEVSLNYSVTAAMRYNSNNYFYKLTHALNTPAYNQSVYLLTNIASYHALLAYFAHIHFVGRFSIVQLISPLSDTTLQHRKDYPALKRSVTSIVIEDLEKIRPQYLMIDQDGYWLYQDGNFIRKSYFSFLQSDAQLNAIFKQYCFKEQIVDFLIFQRCR